MIETGARDVRLDEWINGTRHHPPANEATADAHAKARDLVAWLGRELHELLPAGRDKNLAFTHLEDVLMRANRAIAIHGVPDSR
jgi:Lon protease-like protein